MSTKALLLCLALAAMAGLAATRIDAATSTAQASHSCRVYRRVGNDLCYRDCQCDDITGKPFVCTGEICLHGIADPPPNPGDWLPPPQP